MLKIKKIINLFILSILILSSTNINASQKLIEKEENNYEISNRTQTPYILGPGDSMFILFIGLEMFSTTYTVSPDGFLTLPEIGLINVEGKTLKNLKKILIEKYKDFLYNPRIELSITNYRPINIFIKGQVNRPGLYTLGFSKDKSFSSNKATNNYFVTPKLFDALQKGEGFALNADLTKISVIRKNPESLGGGLIKANVNLLNLFQNGDLNQNIALRDGDIISISKSRNPIIDQLIDINRTNIAPINFPVFVNGNVNSPGTVRVPQASSLIEAIAAAGGIKENTGKIEFVRLSREGSSKKYVFNYDKDAKKSSKENPLLIPGDIIFVNKNSLAKVSSFIDNFARPIVSSYGIYSLFD